MWNKNGYDDLKNAFPIVIILVLIFVAKQELSGLSIKKTFYIIDSLNRMDLFILVFLGLVAVLSMSLYDFILRKALICPSAAGKRYAFPGLRTPLTVFLDLAVYQEQGLERFSIRST